jgi:DJ-1/pfpI family protein
MKALNVLLFDGFTTIDALGPVEAPVLAHDGERKCYEIEYFGLLAGSWAAVRALKSGRES